MTEESRKPGVGPEEVPIRVEDRRFWAREEGPEEAPASGAAPERDGRRYPTYVEELEAALALARERLDETLAAHRRSQAEFDAARTRLNRDVDARVQLAKAELFRKLLEIADHMDLALQVAAQEPEGPMARGVRQIHAQLLSALQEEGVERMEVLGEPFDPETAEAVGVVPVDSAEENDRVVEELRPGYRLGDLTLRAAQVQVGRHTRGQ